MAWSLETDGFLKALTCMVWDGVGQETCSVITGQILLEATMNCKNEVKVNVKDEELLMVFAGVESLLNSRPLRERWMREYVTSIGSCKKWLDREENLKEGNIVLVVDPDTPRRNWNVGRIVGVNPSGDGLVRVVRIEDQYLESLGWNL
ncbi:Hypothetical predicted protein [Paramuricea clavata]|uniref:DUF5641 domain-containing protein n=1 Tax=Paramuricea clavata TaxID=317549 RepID=A0A6S7K824_PARCT|nr:Hypothetical predicted protein [Paramuricea clavata]